MWPAEKFADAISWLEHNYKIDTLLVGHENERAIVEKVAKFADKKGYRPPAWLGKQGEIPLLAGILERADFYFGNDTGPMHMSAGLGIPVVGLFGGGTWPRFLPKGSECHALVRPMPCFYCDWKCCFGDAPCIRDLPLSLIQRVLKTVVMKNRPGRKRVCVHEAKPYPEIMNEFIKKAVETFRKSETDREARLEAIHDFERKLKEVSHDREGQLNAIEDLGKRLHDSDADRVARLEVIRNCERQIQEINEDRQARLRVMEELSKRLQESEADRVAQLRAIQDYDRQVREINEDREDRVKVIEDLGRRLEQSELDGSRVLQHIEVLGRQLKEKEAEGAGHLKMIEDLNSRLGESEADRTARLGVIQDYDRQVREINEDRQSRLKVIEDLNRRLQESEADQAARLQAIRDYEEQIQEMTEDREARVKVIEDLEKRLEQSALDGNRVLGRIEELGRQLKEKEAEGAGHLKMIEDLNKRLEESEADRAARLGVIQDYDRKIREINEDRGARLKVMEDLSKRLQESEADRVARLQTIREYDRQIQRIDEDQQARLKVIEDLTKRLQESEADRVAQLQAIQDYDRQILEINEDRQARLKATEDIEKRLEQSKLDRNQALYRVEELGRLLRESEADRAARLKAIQNYEQELVGALQRLNFSNSVLPKISIITPSFNQGAFIERTIQSVIRQGYPNLEYIIIDGGSTDGTLEVIKKYESYLSYWVSEPDHGQAEAINKGFSKATGDLVSWLNSDDTYTEGALWEWVKAVLRYPKADIWMAKHHHYVDEDDHVFMVVENVFVNHAQAVKYWRMGGIRVNQPSLFFRRQLLEKVSAINPQLRYGLDYEFFLRLSRDRGIRIVDGKWANYRLHRQAKSGTRAGEGFYKFIPEWHLASKKHWSRPWNPRWWGFFISFQFYRPYFRLGQLTSDFIAKRKMVLEWLYLWPCFLWSLIRGRGPLPRW